MPDLLACPDCSGALTNEGARLRCACATWPVVAGIPILTPWAKNEDLRLQDVLVGHLPPLESLPARIWRRLFPPTGRIERAISNRDATFMSLAEDLGRTADLDYFRYRFSDLSFVSTAALLTPLRSGPVLDLGCGAGHLVNALDRRLPRGLFVGLDLHFTLLYLAKRFLAPSALFLCADGSGRLPFRDGAFEASVCADTFNYLPDRSKTAAELLRVTRGPLLLSRLADPSFRGRGAFEPLEPDAYLALFAARAPKLYRDRDLLETFMKTRTLDLSRPGGGRDDVLTLCAGVEPKIHDGADYFVRGGELNPIYDARREGAQQVLSRRFVSEAFAKSYDRFEGVLPESLTISDEQIRSVDPELVRRFILLDLPPNYC